MYKLEVGMRLDTQNQNSKPKYTFLLR